MQDPKRVLFLVPQPFFQWRGSPIRVGFDVQALAESGYEVDLLVMPVGEDRVIPGVQLFRVPNVLRVKKLPIGPSPAKAVLDVFLFFKALRLARKRKYAMIHGVEEAGLMAVLLSRLFRAKSIYEKHSDPASYKQGWLRNLVMTAYAAVERFTIRRADTVIGTGPALVEQARKLGPKGNCCHIFDIPSSLKEAAENDVQKIRNQFCQAPDETLICYVGSFAVYQGIDLLFSAIPITVKKHPQTRFMIIGGSAGEIEERSRQLEQGGVADRVSFVGHVSPDVLPSYLSAADILLSPRIAGHNTPLKLLDYLKVGRAVVATDLEANRLILDDETAEWVEPSPEGLAAGINRLLDDPDQREQLARRGRRLVDETYNYEAFKERLAACYKALEGQA